MSVMEAIFIAIAILGAAVNFTSGHISRRTGASELKIKIAALVVVVAAIAMLFIFSK